MQSLRDYFPKLSEEKEGMLLRLQEIYGVWNERINLISRKDMEYFYERHLLHSLSVARFMDFTPGTTILDVGTGGGFPGIPLAVMFPEVSFTLVDSIAKKIGVVKEVIAALEITNVTAQVERVERMHESFDYVVSRAVTNLPDFVRLAGNRVARKGFNRVPNGILYLKGGDFTEELHQLHGWSQKVYALSDHFPGPFFETKKLVYLFR